MKKLAVIVLALCSIVTACRKEDTKSSELWPRTVEPRLSVPTQWARCCPPPPPPAGHCDDLITTHEQALRVLTTQPNCTDSAITALERFAMVDTGAMNDVAAAYYVRAQRENRPSDLLHALDAADQAVVTAPDLAAARFNRALIQEALGFTAAAMASWDEVRRNSDVQWAVEAREHRERLANARATDAASQWRSNALDARLIELFPAAAQRTFEEELAVADTNKSAQLASELSRITRDRYADDVAAAMAEAAHDPERRDALHKGHAAFREARLAESAIARQKAAAAYATAAQWLARGRSPLHLQADIGLAIWESFRPEPNALSRAMTMLEPVEREAQRRQYTNVLGRVAQTRAYFLEFQGRYVEALTELDRAQSHYERVHDNESIAMVRGNRSTILAEVGQHERAWSEAWLAVRAIPSIVGFQRRHTVFGETAGAASANGHPRIALLYQDAAVRILHNEIGNTPPEDLDRIGKLQKNLAIALRHRAAIELELQHYDRATSNLDEAIRLARNEGDESIRRLMQARVEEVHGQALLRTDPSRAVAVFTRGIDLAAIDEYRTFRASLLAQRAEAWRQAKRPIEAEHDLRAALAELRAEEELILQHRRRGAGEEIWSTYFSRFQETYRILIRQLVEENRADDAFAYVEKARAFEPLDLLRHLESLPPAFRRMVGKDAAVDLAEVRATLPAGTFILEYCVLDDRTYTWVISRDRVQVLTQMVKRGDIERWSEALQRAARKRDAMAFDANVFAPYDKLIAAPLAATGGRPERLVIVPDGAMHGLPFAALRDPVTRGSLIERAPFEIAGSTALYLFSSIQDQSLRAQKSPSVFIVGDPAFSDSLPMATGLQRLPHAKREAERIAALYAPYARISVDEQATVPEFLTEARTHAIVHVAGHAIVNAQAPSRSLLLLAPSAGNAGVLDAEELLTQLKLDQTRLIVLSTCSSAGGSPVGPEGVAPLVRPLIAAGVPAVIGSLWDVDDATAEELLVSFHRHYRQGSEAAVALQAAQLELLRNKNPGLQSAFAWAPFQVIGHASSPYASTQH